MARQNPIVVKGEIHAHKTERLLSKFELGLNDEQLDFIELEFNNFQKGGADKKYEMIEAVRSCFNNPEIKCNDEEWNSYRKYWYKLERIQSGHAIINLTDDQLDSIRQLAPTAKPKEVAEAIFNKKIIPLSDENKLVSRVIKALGIPNANYGSDILEHAYQPPSSDKKLIFEINKNDINAEYNINDLTSPQKRCLAALRNYLRNSRFCAIMNSIKKKSFRDLLESTFIMSTYDKCDLNSEELNMYISLCENYVISLQLKTQMEGINECIDEAIESDAEDAKTIQFNLGKLFSDKMKEFDQCQTRMKQMQESLSSKRSERLSKTAEVNQSLNKFVELWRTEEGRKQFLIISEARDALAREEQKKIESESEHISNIMGINIDEILNA